MKRILFATDGSESAAMAQRFLTALPLTEGTELRVVSVATTWMPAASGFEPVPIPDMAAWEEAQVEAAQKSVSEAVEALKRDGITIDESVPEGQAAYQIIRAAEEFEADLVVVGSKDLKGLEGFVLGSIARNVAHHAGCSVLIAREIKNDLATVILALDGSAHADQALRLTATLLLPKNTRVVAVNAQPLPGMFRLKAPKDTERVLVPAHDLVRKAGEDLFAAGKLAGCEVREGDPAHEILTSAKEHQADLIIAGARGHSFIESLLVGSVADRLLKSATCSLLIVR